MPSTVSPWSHNGPVQLYTLPHTPRSGGNNGIIPTPQDSLPATVAACEADAACAMFTSDGYTIAAYRRTTLPPRQISSESEFLQWQPMQYCTWACCGTWVADGLIPYLLQPVPDTPGANNVRSGPINLQTRDADGAYSLDPELRTTTCVGKAPPGRKREGSPGCPKRCLTACCKQLDSGDTNMGAFFFSQCSGPACAGCRYYNQVVASQQVGNVLMRQYVRAQSSGPAASAAGAAGVSKCSKSSGSAAGSGILC